MACTVSVATLLGLSLATSRDATVATSSNLSKVATARAAAASGIDLASAMLLKADALASLNDAVALREAPPRKLGLEPGPTFPRGPHR